MRPSSAPAFWIVVTCGALLLVAQVLGLHFHRHVGVQGGSVAHPSERHFDGGGLHVGDAHADEGHEHAADDGSSHWHLDLESEALKAGFAKAFLDSSILPLLWLVGLIACAAAMRAPLHPRRASGTTRSWAFGLRPPSQAPPVAARA